MENKFCLKTREQLDEIRKAKAQKMEEAKTAYPKGKQITKAEAKKLALAGKSFIVAKASDKGIAYKVTEFENMAKANKDKGLDKKDGYMDKFKKTIEANFDNITKSEFEGNPKLIYFAESKINEISDKIINRALAKRHIRNDEANWGQDVEDNPNYNYDLSRKYNNMQDLHRRRIEKDLEQKALKKQPDNVRRLDDQEKRDISYKAYLKQGRALRKGVEDLANEKDPEALAYKARKKARLGVGEALTAKQALAKSKAILEEQGEHSGEPAFEEIANKLEAGNTYDYGDYYEWGEVTINGQNITDLLETDKVIDWVLHEIAYPVRDGFDYYNGLNLIFNNYSYTDTIGLSDEVKEDLIKLGFDEGYLADMQDVDSDDDPNFKEIETWINYDINYVENDEDDLEENKKSSRRTGRKINEVKTKTPPKMDTITNLVYQVTKNKRGEGANVHYDWDKKQYEIEDKETGDILASGKAKDIIAWAKEKGAKERGKESGFPIDGAETLDQVYQRNWNRAMSKMNNKSESFRTKGKSVNEISGKLAQKVTRRRQQQLNKVHDKLRATSFRDKDLLNQGVELEKKMKKHLDLKQKANKSFEAISTFSKNSEEYKALSDFANAVNAELENKGSEVRLQIEDTYFDWGQKWMWTTLLAAKNGKTFMQALNPKEQETILLGSTSEIEELKQKMVGELLEAKPVFESKINEISDEVVDRANQKRHANLEKSRANFMKKAFDFDNPERQQLQGKAVEDAKKVEKADKLYNKRRFRKEFDGDSNKLIDYIRKDDKNYKKLTNRQELEGKIGHPAYDIKLGKNESKINEISDELANKALRARVRDAVKANYADDKKNDKELKITQQLIKRKQRQGKELTNDEKEYLKKKSLFKESKINEAEDDNKIKIFLTNLGKYNEGELVGEWVELPVDDFQPILDKIGINDQYEEWFITDYEAPFEIDEYDDIYELNEIAEAIQDFSYMDKAALEVFQDSGYNLRDAIEKVKDGDYIYIHGDTEQDLAYGYIDMVGTFKDTISEDDKQTYFDYEGFGRDLVLGGDYTYTDDSVSLSEFPDEDTAKMVFGEYGEETPTQEELAEFEELLKLADELSNLSGDELEKAEEENNVEYTSFGNLIKDGEYYDVETMQMIVDGDYETSSGYKDLNGNVVDVPDEKALAEYVIDNIYGGIDEETLERYFDYAMWGHSLAYDFTKVDGGWIDIN